MRTTTLMAAVLVVFAPVGAAFAEDAPTPYLTEEERAELIQLLEDSFDRVMELISGLSEEQWTFRENQDRWSVGECTEHIVRSQRALLDYAKQAMSGDPDEAWMTRTQGKNQLLRRVMPNRNPGGAGGATAPMEIRPTEKWDRGKAIAELYKIQGEVRAYVETLEGPVKNHTAEHPFPVFGWLNAYDWLIYIPLHTVRHSKQIVEVKEHADYPKS